MIHTRRHHADVAANPRPLAPADGRGGFPLHARGETRAQFRARLDALGRELAPVGLLEALLVGRLLEALMRLRDCARRRPRVPDPRWLREEAQADRTFWRALRELVAAQKRRGVPLQPEPEPEAEPEPVPPPEPPPPIELDPAPMVNWMDHLELNRKLSRYMPMVRGTRITAEHIAGLLKDEWTIRDILRYFPQLTTDDIRACRDGFAEGQCGPTNEDEWPGLIV